MSWWRDTMGRKAGRTESEEYFLLSRDLLCTASFDGYFTRVNPAWERTLGHAEADLMALPYLDFVHPDDRESTRLEAARLSSRPGETVNFENRYRAADGTYHLLDWSARVVSERGPIYASARDVTAERRVQERSRLLAAIVRSTDDAVISTDIGGEVTSWNRSAERIFGYSEEEMVGRPLDALVPPYRKDEDLGILADVFSAADGVSRVETERLSKDDLLVPISLTVSPIRNEAGKVVGVSWIARDVTERKVLEAEIAHIGRKDSLTGLYNREQFERELRRQLPYTRRHGTGGAVVVLDIDEFSRVNDELGSDCGDRVLAGVAELLIDRLRATDTIARLHGDRFAVLLPEIAPEDARRVGEELTARVGRREFDLDGEKRRVTCSLGIALFGPEDALSAGHLLDAAERAARETKRSGADAPS